MFKASESVTTKNAKIVLEAGLAAIASGQSEFDLTDVKRIDSAAVAVLLAWQRAANVKKVALQLHNLPANLRSLMGLYGVDTLLHCSS